MYMYHSLTSVFFTGEQFCKLLLLFDGGELAVTFIQLAICCFAMSVEMPAFLLCYYLLCHAPLNMASALVLISIF